MIPTLAETYKVIDMFTGPTTTNAAVTSTYVNCTNAAMVEGIMSFNQAASFASVILLKESKSIAGLSVQAVTGNAQWWVNAATGTNDTNVRQADAVSYTLATGTTPQIVIFRFMPANLDAGFNYLNLTIATSSQATDFVAGVWVLYDQYQQATPPTSVGS